MNNQEKIRLQRALLTGAGVGAAVLVVSVFSQYYYSSINQEAIVFIAIVVGSTLANYYVNKPTKGSGK